MKICGDVAIVGAGFAGSLTALVLKQIGLQPILIEKNSHPRFAIGESSTPLANLFLEQICQTYKLDRLQPLCKFGSWQKRYPKIAGGLKRGSSFFKHEKHRPFQPDREHSRELLVAASPNDLAGDTQWFRADIDHFLVQEAVESGVFYSDQTSIRKLKRQRNGWRLACEKKGQNLRVEADWLIDASGGAPLPFRNDLSAGINTNSWAIFSHFENVRPWREILAEKNARLEDYPFHPDDAALHHIFDDGWMWVLRFNNGVTSAGFVLNGEKYAPTFPENPGKEWERLLELYPSIAAQFAGASAVQPFTLTGLLQRKLSRSFGDGWIALPHAAYFLDPFFSAGNAHTLLGILRLGDAFQKHWQTPEFTAALQTYDRQLQREIEFVDWLIHGSYQAFSNFDLLAAFSMYYYTGSIFSEHRYRSGAADLDDEFLFSQNADFRACVKKGYRRLIDLTENDTLSPRDLREFRVSVAVDISPWNLAGLCAGGRNNMYPFV